MAGMGHVSPPVLNSLSTDSSLTSTISQNAQRHFQPLVMARSCFWGTLGFLFRLERDTSHICRYQRESTVDMYDLVELWETRKRRRGGERSSRHLRSRAIYTCGEPAKPGKHQTAGHNSYKVNFSFSIGYDDRHTYFRYELVYYNQEPIVSAKWDLGDCSHCDYRCSYRGSTLDRIISPWCQGEIEHPHTWRVSQHFVHHFLIFWANTFCARSSQQQNPQPKYAPLSQEREHWKPDESEHEEVNTHYHKSGQVTSKSNEVQTSTKHQIQTSRAKPTSFLPRLKKMCSSATDSFILRVLSSTTLQTT